MQGACIQTLRRLLLEKMMQNLCSHFFNGPADLYTKKQTLSFTKTMRALQSFLYWLLKIKANSEIYIILLSLDGAMELKARNKVVSFFLTAVKERS